MGGAPIGRDAIQGRLEREMPELTVDQWLQVANTVVLTITAAIIVWYTWETRRLRQEAQDQSKNLANQLHELRQQVEIQRSQLEIEQERRKEEEELRMAEDDPVLQFHDAQVSGGRIMVTFYNVGGSIRDIDVRPANEEEIGQLDIDKYKELRNGEAATITFAGANKHHTLELIESPFVLEYTNKHGKRRKQTFRYNGGQRIERF